MSTEHEAHLVVGVLESDLEVLHHTKDEEGLSSIICKLQEDTGYHWYEEDGILGTSVHSCADSYITTDLERIKLGERIVNAICEVEKALGCKTVLHTCVYTY